MEPETNLDNPCQPCPEFEPMLALLAADELNVAEQAEAAEHLAHCTPCSKFLANEKALLALILESRREPDAAMLASCRAGLEDALDRAEERGTFRRLIASVMPSGWLVPNPVWSAALLLLVGFSVGVLGPRFVHDHAVPANASTTAAQPAPNEVIPDSSSAPFDVHSAQIAGLNVFPAGGNEPAQVEFQIKSQAPIKIQGTVNNENVKDLLIKILFNNDRYDPDVRLDAVDLLRARNNDPDVRSALCHAVHTDNNAAVRLKALEALNGAEPQDLVRQTLLEALVDDSNPGVRVEAINTLRGWAASGQVVPDDHMLAVLRERMKKDPNTYIRIQSAAAIRDLGPREKF
jgi:hypothetical protein